MNFVCNCKSQPVRVTKEDEEDQFEFQTLHRISDKMEASTAATFVLGINTFTDKIDTDEVEKMIFAGKIRQVEDIVPFGDIETDLKPLSEKVRTAVVRSGTTAIGFLPPIPRKMRFDATNPRISEYIFRNVGSLIVSIEEETRKNVATMIRRSFNDGLTPRQASVGIRNVVGLTPRMENSLNNFRTKLLKKFPESRVEKMVAAKRTKMIKHRSVVIARTELIRSVNFAQLEVWNQAADNNIIDRRTAQKEWVSVFDKNTSDVCNELDGKRALINETFFSGVLGTSFMAPPAHVQCRSGLILVNN